MELSPWHIGISVADLSVSVPWYETVLGFCQVRGYWADSLKAQICFLSRDGFELELFQYECPRPLPPERRHPDTDLQTVGTKHLAFRVDNLSAMLLRLNCLGVDIAHRTIAAGKQVCFIRDPDGILIELIQPAKIPEQADTFGKKELTTK